MNFCFLRDELEQSPRGGEDNLLTPPLIHSSLALSLFKIQTHDNSFTFEIAHLEEAVDGLLVTGVHTAGAGDCLPLEFELHRLNFVSHHLN